jgi:indole-3-glycerol phosphate synthase
MSKFTILDNVVSHKREEVRRKRQARPVGALEAESRMRRSPLSLAAVLAKPGVSLIAEIKRQSISQQAYAMNFDATRLAQTYSTYGAAAISVLADEQFFGGGPKVVEEVSSAVAGAVPVIYKDFIVDPYQVAEARALGADSVLIIVRAVDAVALRESVSLAHALGMDCVVEVFTPEDAREALGAGARIIGINNRDLSTLRIDIERSASMRAMLPSNVLSVSESGLASADDVRRAGMLGFNAVLIGEAILAAEDVAAKVRELSRAGELVMAQTAVDERQTGRHPRSPR